MISDSFLGLEGQHIVITGSSGGIGLVLARKYLLQGANVSLHYNSNCKTLEPLLNEFPSKTFACQANATDELAIAALFFKANEKFGVVNVLIANHGISNRENTDIVDMSLDRWQKTIEVNLTGTFLFVREFLRQMKGHLKTLSEQSFANFRECSIVIIGSTAGKFGEAFHAEYAATKSALMYGFTRSLKNEIVKIHPKARVNVVAPGWVRTPLAEESLKRGEHFKALQTMPLLKIATAEDVSNAVIFLSSSKSAGHTTGNIIEVDGGMEGRVLNSLEEVKK